MRTVSTVYETQSGFITSPNPVAIKAGLSAVVPTGPFSDGYQDFNTTNKLRVWYSEATGAHSGAGHIAVAWVPELGLAITDETGDPTGTTMQFEHGKITWTPWTGSKITWAPGSTLRRRRRPDDHSRQRLQRPLRRPPHRQQRRNQEIRWWRG